MLNFPLVGETTATAKDTHNIVMLLIVATAGAYAIRRQSQLSLEPRAW